MLIIFDCDGVLRSFSWQIIYEAYLEIAKYLQINPRDFWKDVDDYRKWYDYNWRLNLERMGVSKEDDVSKIVEIFDRVCKSHSRIFPWVENVVGELASRHDLAILSTASFSNIQKSFCGLAKHFQMIVGREHVKKLKPDPEGIFMILKKTRAKASEGIIIGDTCADISTGKNAGMKTAGVTWGLGTEEELKDFADLVFTDPQQLLNIE